MDGITVLGNRESEAAKKILTPNALAFIGWLHRQFNPRRVQLLQRRSEVQQRINAGAWKPEFLPETAHIRNSEWRVAPPPADLQKRHCEITGPTSPAKMVR